MAARWSTFLITSWVAIGVSDCNGANLCDFVTLTLNFIPNFVPSDTETKDLVNHSGSTLRYTNSTEVYHSVPTSLVKSRNITLVPSPGAVFLE